MKKPTETALVRQCLELLTHLKLFHWRANSGGGLRGGRLIRANADGTPDILAIIPLRYAGSSVIVPDTLGRPVGRLWGIEAKTKTGRLRESQKAWIENASRSGAICLVVRDVKELEAALRTEGVIV